MTAGIQSALFLVGLGFSTLSLRELDIGNDRRIVFALLAVSAATLLLPLPSHFSISEFENAGRVDAILNQGEFGQCTGYVDGECTRTNDAIRPPGFPLLVLPFTLLGTSPLQAALWLNGLIGVASTAVFYALTREFSGRRGAFLASLLFVLSVPRLRLLRTGLSSVPSLFFLLLSAYFLFRDHREGGHSQHLVFSLSSFLHLRPENFLISLPLVAAAAHALLNDDSPRNKRIALAAFLMLSFASSAAFTLGQASGVGAVESWSITSFPKPETLYRKLTETLLFFVHPAFFNPLATLASLTGLALLPAKKRAPACAMALSLLAYLAVYTSFEPAHFLAWDSYGLKYAFAPSALLLAFSGPALDKSKLAILIILLSAALAFNSHVLSSDHHLQVVVESLWDDEFDLANESVVATNLPSAVHFAYPEKTVTLPDPGLGDFVYLELGMGQTREIPGNRCNLTQTKAIAAGDAPPTRLYQVHCT